MVDEHPLPWLAPLLNGVEHANFFEQRATEYSKGATTGAWDGEGGVWNRFDFLLASAERPRRSSTTP
jgi:ribonucleoside-diphosphate reductase beta chain